MNNDERIEELVIGEEVRELQEILEALSIVHGIRTKEESKITAADVNTLLDAAKLVDAAKKRAKDIKKRSQKIFNDLKKIRDITQKEGMIITEATNMEKVMSSVESIILEARMEFMNRKSFEKLSNTRFFNCLSRVERRLNYFSNRIGWFVELEKQIAGSFRK